VLDDSFCRALPGPQTAVDIFAGQWSSRLPPPYETLTGGTAPLFEDDRITWGDTQFGGVNGMRVLELGPLEGGHTFMLDRLGASEVTAIEANQQAFLRCLVVKELLGIPSARFLCGDFIAHLRDAVERQARWDLCVASGVLYHQQDPVTLLELATQVSDRLFLWTHYYDAGVIDRRPELAAKFAAASEMTTSGFGHTLYRYEYGEALDWQGFCGGLASWTTWMSKSDIVGALEHFGFEVVGTAFDDLDHPNGPAFCLAARKG
jgi:hypothetical protein